MPIFFTGDDEKSPVGRTVALEDRHTSGTTTFLSVDPELRWSSHRSIITRMTVSHQGNYQFLHTVGNDIYIYVFGDRAGQMTLSGLAMAHDCDSEGDREHGFEKVTQWYNDNRVAQRKEPVMLTIGQQTVINGFVVGMTGDIVDPSTRIVQYGLQLMTLPEKE